LPLEEQDLERPHEKLKNVKDPMQGYQTITAAKDFVQNPSYETALAAKKKLNPENYMDLQEKSTAINSESTEDNKSNLTDQTMPKENTFFGQKNISVLESLIKESIK